MNDTKKPIILNIDEDPRNADWLKFRWHLPPYKSPKFMAMIRGQFSGATDEERLAQFRTLPVYEFAVERGRIVDDEWVSLRDRQ